MTLAVDELDPALRNVSRTTLAIILWGLAAFHILLVLIVQPHPVAASRLATAAAPLLAAFCGLWRAQRVPIRERLPWRMLSASMMLWAAGQAVEALIGPSPSFALNPSVDASDFIDVIAAFPMLLTASNTQRTESIRSVFYLDSVQIALAAMLTYVLLYRAPMSATQATTAMGSIYAVECGVLALSTILRLATWSTLEERKRIHLVGTGVWMFVPIYIGMSYASSHWNLHAGTIFDMLWSVPFIYAGWQALYMPTTKEPQEVRKRLPKRFLLIESLCPMLVTASVFVLAASITVQHPVLGLSAIFLLLFIQSLHAGMVQLNYVAAQNQLLDREQELKRANAALERLSMLDPLTSIPNRRRFDAAFDEVWRRAMRRRKPVALLIIDVDFFKSINDLYGHGYGDECLMTVARVVGNQAGRPDDLLARYGGDEFVLLLPETDMNGAVTVAKRIHAAIQPLAIANSASPFEGRLTLTVGIGVGNAKPGMDAASLLGIADQALYEAKRQGRNRTCTQTL
jgi:diguanylate cyclase (GGDEF)-like protein